MQVEDSFTERKNNEKYKDQTRFITLIETKLSLLLKKNESSNEIEEEEVKKKITLLKLRLHLLQNIKELNETRISTLEKIFKHYCNHMYKAGRHQTFERLEYEKTHLTMERFFAFVNDFALNQASTENSIVNVLENTEIILLFKKASSNAKNLEISEFVACIEAMAVVYFDARHSYEKRKALLLEKKKKRREEYLKKEQAKILKEKKKKEQEAKENEREKNKTNVQIENEENEEKIETDEKKLEENEIEEKNTPEEENDNLIKEMLEDKSIEHPNKEVPTFKQIEKKTELNDDAENELFKVTKEEKIEYYYELMCVDNSQQALNRMREFEKPLLKHKNSIETKESFDSKTFERIEELKKQLKNREQIKNKSILARSLSEEEYARKKEQMQEKHFSKKEGKQKNKKEEITPRELSLDLIKQSSLDDINLKANLEKYFCQDESDKIFMGEYGGYDNYKVINRVGSSVLKNNIAAEIKKRAVEVENAERINEDKKIARFGLQKLKNNHYIGKFLERKW